jgi:P4 family phage/plasmid primase-like protien
MIQPQLQNSEFRFIKVAPKSKRPIENDWQETANYPYDSQELQDYLAKGGNYGIICGPGGIRILDCDDLARLEELGVLAKFPKTFSVQSRPGRIHRYYMIPELKKKITLFDPILKDDNGQPCHLGEIQGPGTQIIGPGSIHQNTGQPYKVIDDSPIAALSLEQVTYALEGLKTSRLEANCARLEAMPKRAIPQKEEDPFRHIRIDDIAYPSGETRRIGDEIQGAHPVHNSTTGKNFRIDLKKNTWYCDRCHTGGGPALWLAVKNGIIRCDQASAGSLRGDDFKKVWRIAEHDGLIAKSGPTFKKLEKKEPKEHEISLDEVTDVEVFNAGKDNERVERTFSPDKAADAIIQALHIVSTPDEKIWIYQGGYYRNNGAVIIDRTLDRIAGDLYTIRASKEVQKKIFLRTMSDFDLFDQDPYLLCVKNGVVNLLDGTFSEHNPNYYLTSASPVSYDENARPTLFLKFLQESCSNDDDRVTLIDWMVACAILAEFEYILFLTGHGSNGKHVYEAILQALFGLESTEAISLEELMSSKFAMGNLRRARLCISSETNPDKTKTELIKKISGNDWLSSDVKNKDRIRFKAFCQLLFDSNSMPIFEDTSYGFTRRFTRANMPYKFVDCPDPKEPLQKLKDPHLLEKLMAEEEMSGILNLIILRAKEIAKDKKIHRRENDFEKYEEQSYSINDFMDKFIEFNPEYRDLKDYHESADFVFSKFEEYTKYMIGAKASRKKFSILLGKENGEASRTVRPIRAGFDGMAVRGFRGIKFDLDSFSSFIEEKKKEYSCNACNDPVTDGRTDGKDNGKDNVTLVTIFSRILYMWDEGQCPIVVRDENATSLQTENPIENASTDNGERMEESCNGSVTTLDGMKDYMCVGCDKLLTVQELRVLDGSDYCPECYDKETAKPKEISILAKAIEELNKHCTPISPFVLAINAENYGAKLTPKQCEAWMKAHNWIQESGKWKVA